MATSKIDLLKKINLFEDLTYYELVLMSSIAQRKFFNAETVIFEENSKGNEFYMIESGAVRISKIITDLGEEALAIMREGEYFGEMALIDDAPRSATAIAHEQTYLVTIAKDDFEKLLFLNKKIAKKMLWKFVRTLSDRVRETTEKYRGLSAMAGF